MGWLEKQPFVWFDLVRSHAPVEHVINERYSGLIAKLIIRYIYFT
jgi:hypothetical protein